MKIFLSYSARQRDLAERLALGLRNEGHEVFFDRDALQPGESFDDRIRASIRQCQLFVFLISKDSLSAGAYTLTELGMAQERWPSPAGYVMPICVDDTEIDTVPPYLGAVSILQPTGNTVAEVLNAVGKLKSQRRRILGYRLAALAPLIVVATAVVWWQTHQRAPVEFESINVTELETYSDKTHYRFDASIRNKSAESTTVVGLRPHTNSDAEFRGIGGQDFLHLNSSESTSVTVYYSLTDASNAGAFTWQFCYDYVSTESYFTELIAKDLNVDQFMAEYSKEACGAGQRWEPNAAQQE